MGTLSFSVGHYAPSRGQAPALISSEVVTSGTHSTSTTASNVEVASADISVERGHVFRAFSDENMRIRFGGTAATTTTGHLVPAGVLSEFEVTEPGAVSICDVA
jgi:hypothetical protein